MSTQPAPESSQEFASVRFSAAGVSEMDGTRAIVHVPTADIRSLSVQISTGSERPLITCVIGLVLLLIGVAPFITLLTALINGDDQSIWIKLFGTAGFAFLGVWLLRFALKRRVVLVAQTEKGARRLVFHKSTSLADAQKFVAASAAVYGYAVYSPSHYHEKRL